MRRDRVLVSAHRCGAGGDRSRENTLPALEQALELGVDYVEIDVRRCADGTLVLFHDKTVEVGGAQREVADLTYDELRAVSERVLRYDEALATLAGRAGAHLDLKDPTLESAVEATRLAHRALGEGRTVVTIREDDIARAVREWTDESGAAVLVALSLGTGLGDDRPVREKLRVLRSELFCRRRVKATRVHALAVNHGLARLGVAAFARRTGLPLLVWTVDADRNLAYWTRPGRAWMVTTNLPRLALRLRERA